MPAYADGLAVILPPLSLTNIVHTTLFELLCTYPDASSSEAFLQNHLEFAIIRAVAKPKYFLRIGINYHGKKVQHLMCDEKGRLIGWNPAGDALGTSSKAKMLLAGHTIFGRDVDEQKMSDTKIGGGDIPINQYVRIEFKARGWLGKTKNRDGKQFEKDIDLLKSDRADLIVVCLSETAHLKWRGEGPTHHAVRRTGTHRFRALLIDPQNLHGTEPVIREITFEQQSWSVLTRRALGRPDSIMPGAEHFITMCWRREVAG